MPRSLGKSLCEHINKGGCMNYFMINFCVRDPTTVVCMCVWLPRALFSKRKKWVPTFLLLSRQNGTVCVASPAPPAWDSSLGASAELSEGSGPVGRARLSPATWVNQGKSRDRPFTLGFHRGLPVLSAPSPLSDGLRLSLLLAESFHPFSLALTCIIFPGICRQIAFPRSVASSSCPCCVLTPTRGMRGWQKALGGVGKAVSAATSHLPVPRGSCSC